MTLQDDPCQGTHGLADGADYGRRSHAETAMICDKASIGSGLRARLLPAQKVEAKLACSVLNRMTGLGRNASVSAHGLDTASGYRHTPVIRIMRLRPPTPLASSQPCRE